MLFHDPQPGVSGGQQEGMPAAVGLFQRHRDPGRRRSTVICLHRKHEPHFLVMGSIFWPSGFRCLANRKPVPFLHNLSLRVCDSLSLEAHRTRGRDGWKSINGLHTFGALPFVIPDLHRRSRAHRSLCYVSPWSPSSSTLTPEHIVSSSESLGGGERETGK